MILYVVWALLSAASIGYVLYQVNTKNRIPSWKVLVPFSAFYALGFILAYLL